MSAMKKRLVFSINDELYMSTTLNSYLQYLSVCKIMPTPPPPQAQWKLVNTIKN